jgi:hypothetical protein
LHHELVQPFEKTEKCLKKSIRFDFPIHFMPRAASADRISFVQGKFSLYVYQLNYNS